MWRRCAAPPEQTARRCYLSSVGWNLLISQRFSMYRRRQRTQHRWRSFLGSLHVPNAATLRAALAAAIRHRVTAAPGYRTACSPTMSGTYLAYGGHMVLWFLNLTRCCCHYRSRQTISSFASPLSHFSCGISSLFRSLFTGVFFRSAHFVFVPHGILYGARAAHAGSRRHVVPILTLRHARRPLPPLPFSISLPVIHEFWSA